LPDLIYASWSASFLLVRSLHSQAHFLAWGRGTVSAFHYARGLPSSRRPGSAAWLGTKRLALELGRPGLHFTVGLDAKMLGAKL